jgi:hypothetical protein
MASRASGSNGCVNRSPHRLSYPSVLRIKRCVDSGAARTDAPAALDAHCAVTLLPLLSSAPGAADGDASGQTLQLRARSAAAAGPIARALSAGRNWFNADEVGKVLAPMAYPSQHRGLLAIPRPPPRPRPEAESTRRLPKLPASARQFKIVLSRCQQLLVRTQKSSTLGDVAVGRRFRRAK